MPEDDTSEQEETCTEEIPASAAPAPEYSIVEYSVVEYSWEDIDPMIPAEEVRGVAWRLDRTCLFPDRPLLALVRRPRVLPHMRKPKPARKKAAGKGAPAPRRRPHKPKHAPAGLVTRPGLLQLALGF